jgi:hypothetical protein
VSVAVPLPDVTVSDVTVPDFPVSDLAVPCAARLFGSASFAAALVALVGRPAAATRRVDGRGARRVRGAVRLGAAASPEPGSGVVLASSPTSPIVAHRRPERSDRRPTSL